MNLDKIFDEWLFSDKETKKTYNPFLRMFAAIHKDKPFIPQVKMEKEKNDRTTN
jgi:hypothetical protein